MLAQLGEGAMGTVYRARDPILDRDVALKTVAQNLLSKQDSLIRFQREARAAAKLQHPNIVTIYELGEAEGLLYIAMELLDGMDLAQALTPPLQMTFEQKIRVLLEMCRGLDFAHKRGVVHRDVKPANVRVLPDGHIKIVDFGIARLADSNMTQTGMVLGTPSYMAPEVLVSGRVDHRADMWAVGVVLHEMLTGHRPFESPTIMSLVYKIVHEALPPVDAGKLGVPPALAEVVTKALDKDPSGRYQDLAEMGYAIQNAVGVVAPSETPLIGPARERLVEAYVHDALLLFANADFERALEAAKRARALEPSRTDIVALIEKIESSVQDLPTIGVSASQLEIPVVPVGAASTVASAGTPTPASASAGQAGAAHALLRSEPRSSRALAAAGATVASDAAPAVALRTPTPAAIRGTIAVVADLRVRGASAFREVACFGEPPATVAVALSPVKEILVTSGADGGIRLWDLRSRLRVATLRTEMHRRTGHDASALAVAFSADGRRLASGHVDGSVHLWDMESHQEIAAKMKHEAMVSALAFAPDGTMLASGGMDSNLKLWDLAALGDGETRRALHRQPAGVTALAYAQSGACLVTGHVNRILRVLDARTCRLQATLRGAEAQVNLLYAVPPDGRRVAAASHDRTVRFYDLESKQQTGSVGGHRKPTTSLSFFADGAYMASVGLDNLVQLWEVDSGRSVAALWGPNDEVFTGVALFASGSHIAVALSDGRIRIWGPAA